MKKLLFFAGILIGVFLFIPRSSLAAGNFSLTVTPTIQNVSYNSTATFNVTITPLNGFRGAILLGRFNDIGSSGFTVRDSNDAWFNNWGGFCFTEDYFNCLHEEIQITSSNPVSVPLYFTTTQIGGVNEIPNDRSISLIGKITAFNLADPNNDFVESSLVTVNLQLAFFRVNVLLDGQPLPLATAVTFDLSGAVNTFYFYAADSSISAAYAGPISVMPPGNYTISNIGSDKNKIFTPFVPLSDLTRFEVVSVSPGAPFNLPVAGISDITINLRSVPSGNINVNSTLNGAPWSGAINYTLIGPETITGITTPAYFFKKLTGIYSLAYQSGGPAGATGSSITPTISQILTNDSLITYTINFIAPQYNLLLIKSGTGSGAVKSNPVGINCGRDCSENYNIGTSVALTASPSAGSAFIGWSGACSGAGVCVVAMTQARNVTATFSSSNVSPNPPFNLSFTPSDYCVSDPSAILSWTFSDPNVGDIQSKYQVQIDDNASFSSVNIDSGVITSASNSYAIPQGQLAYNIKYYWRVKVWDNKNASSNWSNTANFTTPGHQYPFVNFSWAPATPSVDNNVQLTDQSQVFGGSTKSAWAWTFQDGNPASAIRQDPAVKFTSSGQKQVRLRLTDSDGFSCQLAKAINVELKLPWWKEIFQ